MSTTDHRRRARGGARPTHAGGRTQTVLELTEAAEPVLGEILKRARAHKGLTLRDVEERTGIPNPHLSQIERGQIKRPDAKILWELCELYLLDYARLAEWSGYLEHGTSRDSAIVAVALRILSKLEHKDQIEALRYLESLESRSRLANHE